MAKKEKVTRLVFSTETGSRCQQCLRPLVKCVCGDARPAGSADGIVRIRRETKGRGGKAVTVIEGLTVPTPELKDIAKRLKQRCGVGGAVKDGCIEIQGDQRTVCLDTLTGLGFTCKLAGG